VNDDRQMKPWEAEVLDLFPIPLYTDRGIYFEEDLQEAGLTRALKRASPETRKTVLQSAETLASIKPELAFYFLSKAPVILKSIPPESLQEWVRACLDIYDASGLNPARTFILETEDRAGLQFQPASIAFEKVSGILQNLLHALGRGDLCLRTGAESYTDGEAVFVPPTLTLLADPRRNFLLYKVMVTHKIGQLRLGTYRLRDADLSAPPDSSPNQGSGSEWQSPLSRFFQRFSDPALISDLYLLADALRVEDWIAHQYPGLFRRLTALKQDLALQRQEPSGSPPQTQAVSALISWYLSGCPSSQEHPQLKSLLSAAGNRALSSEGLADLARRVYAAMPAPDRSPTSLLNRSPLWGS
jgi:hypothetical protein